MTPDEYLAWEREQPEKHEYFDGEIFAMSGGSLNHSRLSVRMTTALELALGARGCEVHSSDLRVGLDGGKRFVYPDASVICGRVELRPGTRDVLINPTILVEVLSPSSEALDRGAKLQGYRRLPSLTDYLLVSQHLALVERFYRVGDIGWDYASYGKGTRVQLSNGAELEVDAIYAGIDFPED